MRLDLVADPPRFGLGDVSLRGRRRQRVALLIGAGQRVACLEQLALDARVPLGELVDVAARALVCGFGIAERRTADERGNARLGGIDLRPGRREGVEVGVDRRKLLAQLRGFRDQRLDHTFVGDGGELTLESARAFGHEVDEPAAALPKCFGASQQVGDVVVTRDRQRVLGFDHFGVERPQPNSHILFLLCEVATSIRSFALASAQLVDLTPGEMDAHRVELGHDAVVPARRVGLTLEGPELPAHFAEQVGEPQQIAFGGVEPALRLFLALAELENARRLLDDRPAILGTSVEHGVELTLSDDDVLLAADAGIGEQLLDVEQPARRAVDHVLRLAGAEQHPGDRHFGELDRQQVSAVVDGERDLGASEGGTISRAREDDVVHLPAAQRPGPLCTEHPRHRVHDVRLARAVRADDDADARLEVERGLVRERLEALQRQRFEEQRGPPLRPRS